MAKIKETTETEGVETPNRDKLLAIYEAYKKQSPIQYEMFKEEYARNLAKSEQEIGRIIGQ